MEVYQRMKKKTFILCKEAADKGYVKAQTSLGLMYVLGKGTEENIDKAIKYFKLAASSGSKEAKEYLAPKPQNPLEVKIFYIREVFYDLKFNN